MGNTFSWCDTVEMYEKGDFREKLNVSYRFEIVFSYQSNRPHSLLSDPDGITNL